MIGFQGRKVKVIVNLKQPSDLGFTKCHLGQTTIYIKTPAHRSSVALQAEI